MMCADCFISGIAKDGVLLTSGHSGTHVDVCRQVCQQVWDQSLPALQPTPHKVHPLSLPFPSSSPAFPILASFRLSLSRYFLLTFFFLFSMIVTVKFWDDTSRISNAAIAKTFNYKLKDVNLMEKWFLSGMHSLLFFPPFIIFLFVFSFLFSLFLLIFFK